VGATLGLTSAGTPAGGTYAWTGPNGFSSAQQNPSIPNVQLVNGGLYTVTYTSTAGCIGTATTTAVINTASVTANNNGPKCVGATLGLTSAGTPAGGTYAWTGPNGFSSALQNPSIPNVQLVNAGLYTVTYTSTAGCIATATTTVVINTASVTANNDGPKCVGATLGLTSAGTPAGGTYAWTGPNGFSSALQNPSIPNVQLVNAGLYTVTYTSTAGCIATATTTAVIGAASVTVANDGPKCVGATLGLTSAGTPAGGTYAWTGPNGFSSAQQNPSIPNVQLVNAGLYTVTYTSTAGCIGTGTTTVVIDSASVTAGNDGPKCVGQTVCLTSVGIPAGGTYAWTGPNGFTSTSQNPCIASVTAAVAGEYTVTYTSVPGCTATNKTTVVVNPLPSCTLTAPDPLPQCASPGNQLCATDLANAAQYLWTVWSSDDSWQITGRADTSCVTYTAGNGGTTGVFKLVVTSEPGCVDSCTVEFTCISTQRFCTLTQGAYGNSNGMFNGLRRLPLIQSLITPENPLVIGKTTGQTVPKVVAARSLTFPDGAEQCIIDRLPAGGPAAALPSAIGNATINSASNCTNPLLTLQNGRFRNVFIGQVITLSLNSRLDENLPGLTICGTMVTVRSITDSVGNPAPDPTDTGKTVTLPARIFTALANLGLPKTVGGLLSLANLGIAGQFTDVATIGDLNTAVSSINEGFDECRFLVKCMDGQTDPGVVGGSGEYVDETAAGIALPVEFGLSASMPNPFSNVTTVRLSLPERSSVQLSVYNVLGQEVAKLADGELSAGIQSVQWNAVSRSGNPVAPGVYFFSVRAHGLESGRAFTRTQKALFIK
jgi:methionine-rich copper-binding protein CopC